MDVEQDSVEFFPIQQCQGIGPGASRLGIMSRGFGHHAGRVAKRLIVINNQKVHEQRRLA